MVTVAVLEISCSMAVMSRLPLLVLLTKTTTTNTVSFSALRYRVLFSLIY